jgi:ectoine hydroxylase-related dioxygenase (phytanoyl-CoA dioxygenase family)
VLLSDQPTENMGNLWVWPGTHLTDQAFFGEHGPDALLGCGGYPPIALPTPEQVRGRAGDLLLAHYLLGHNIGGNTSDTVRRAAYFRVKRVGHALRWPARSSVSTPSNNHRGEPPPSRKLASVKVTAMAARYDLCRVARRPWTVS